MSAFIKYLNLRYNKDNVQERSDWSQYLYPPQAGWGNVGGPPEADVDNCICSLCLQAIIAKGGGGMNKINRTILTATTVAAVLMPVLVLAVILPTPTPPTGGQGIDLNEIEALISRIAQFLIIVSVIIAVIFIIWGGIMYMAARGDEDKATKAKTTIYNGIIGAAVVLGVGVILQTLSKLITRSFFS